MMRGQKHVHNQKRCMSLLNLRFPLSFLFVLTVPAAVDPGIRTEHGKFCKARGPACDPSNFGKTPQSEWWLFPVPDNQQRARILGISEDLLTRASEVEFSHVISSNCKSRDQIQPRRHEYRIQTPSIPHMLIRVGKLNNRNTFGILEVFVIFVNSK